MSTTWSAVKARKPHRCDEVRPGCSGIHPGDVYHRAVWFPEYRGEAPAVYRTCPSCMAERERDYGYPAPR